MRRKAWPLIGLKHVIGEVVTGRDVEIRLQIRPDHVGVLGTQGDLQVVGVVHSSGRRRPSALHRTEESRQSHKSARVKTGGPMNGGEASFLVVLCLIGTAVPDVHAGLERVFRPAHSTAGWGGTEQIVGSAVFLEDHHDVSKSWQGLGLRHNRHEHSENNTTAFSMNLVSDSPLTAG
jgi:hypothetical protein